MNIHCSDRSSIPGMGWYIFKKVLTLKLREILQPSLVLASWICQKIKQTVCTLQQIIWSMFQDWNEWTEMICVTICLNIFGMLLESVVAVMYKHSYELKHAKPLVWSWLRKCRISCRLDPLYVILSRLWNQFFSNAWSPPIFFSQIPWNFLLQTCLYVYIQHIHTYTEYLGQT